MTGLVYEQREIGVTERQVLLEAINLHVKRGGASVLDIPSFHLNKGEVVSLIGPNGAGKTTLLETLACLLKPVSGELRFRGLKVGTDVSFLDYRRRLAMVFQDALLFDTTVFNNVGSGLTIRGVKRPQAPPLIMEQLERFGISHLAGRGGRRLSGGEAQRTSLARAFATGPEVLLLDEPFGSLDEPSRESLIEDLQAALRNTGTTALFATHDRTEALRLSDRIGVMKDGRLIQIGTPEEVMNHPASEFVASFVGVETILNGVVARLCNGSFTVSVGGHEIEAVADVQPGEGVVLCVRPEHVALAPHSSENPTSARNLFAGKITRIIPMGLYQKIHLDCGFPLVSYITNQSLRELSLREGERVDASFKATAVHVIRRRPLSPG